MRDTAAALRWEAVEREALSVASQVCVGPTWEARSMGTGSLDPERSMEGGGEVWLGVFGWYTVSCGVAGGLLLRCHRLFDHLVHPVPRLQSFKGCSMGDHAILVWVVCRTWRCSDSLRLRGEMNDIQSAGSQTWRYAQCRIVLPEVALQGVSSSGCTSLMVWRWIDERILHAEWARVRFRLRGPARVGVQRHRLQFLGGG